ncbi:NUDIX domain-containing protein [Streptomyces sp. NPDC048473]|uniref:NUDIX domain-containing protein n=1 Tax=unclassified Streptomyces TaxID=2593676 RepID=UPI0037155794
MRDARWPRRGPGRGGPLHALTAGGELEPGESHEQAASRELPETTGPTHVTPGPDTSGGPPRSWPRRRICCGRPDRPPRPAPRRAVVRGGRKHAGGSRGAQDHPRGRPVG